MTFMTGIPQREQNSAKGTFCGDIKSLLQTGAIKKGSNTTEREMCYPMIFFNSLSKAKEAAPPKHSQSQGKEYFHRKNCTEENYFSCLKDYWKQGFSGLIYFF